MPNRAWLLSVLFPLILTATESKDYEFNVAWSYRSPDCVERPIVTINDDFPGPTIRVKVGEEVRVKVNNNLPSDAITIHWHGQEQRKNVWHDGIGMISNCPIPPKTSFTYIFRVNDKPGTYFYHGHLGGIRAAGLYGVLIIDPAAGVSEQWSYDGEHTLLLSDWYHAIQHELSIGLLEEEFRWAGDPQSIILNGKGFFNCSDKGVSEGTPFPYWKPGGTVYCHQSKCPGHEILEVEKGKTYRLRLINTAELSFMNFAIENHSLTVVEADGLPVQGMNVTSLDINSGQRYSVLFTADQAVDAYWVSVMTRHRKNVVTGQAILKYKGANKDKPDTDVDVVKATQPTWDNSSASYAQQSQLRGKDSAPPNDKVTRTIIMLGTQERYDWSSGVQYNNPMIPPEDNCNSTGRHLRWAVNRVSYKWETTPVLHMVYFNLAPNTMTEERGYFKINSGDVIDIVVQNYPACNRVCEQHPWHLHGHKFWVVGMGLGNWNGSAEQIASLEPENAVKRDTVTVLPDAEKPFGGQREQGGCGWVVVRFVAENPGVWPFHCHITWHFVMGMQVIFIESADKLPKPSSNIAACGDVTPQMFVDKMKSDETPKAGGEKDCKDDTTLLVILLIGWGLFVVSFVLVIALFCRLRQMLGFSLDKSNNVAMT